MDAINLAIRARSVSLTLARPPTAKIGSWINVVELFVRAATFFCPARRLRLRQLLCPLQLDQLEKVRQLTHTELEAAQEHQFLLTFVLRTLAEGLIARVGALMVAREQSAKATLTVVLILALKRLEWCPPVPVLSTLGESRFRNFTLHHRK